MSGSSIFMLIIALFLFIIVLLIRLAYLSEKKREKWRNAGAQAGLNYFVHKPAGWIAHFGFDLITKGDMGNVKNAFEHAELGTVIRICDYSYYNVDDGSFPKLEDFTLGKTQSIAVVSIDGRQMPYVYMVRGASTLTRPLETMGRGDRIDLDDPEFSRSFTVFGQHEEGVRSFVAPKLRAAFNEHRNSISTFETSGSAFLIVFKRRIKPDNLKYTADIVRGIINVLQ